MKNFRSKSGPFHEQPYYAISEIESICTDELQKVDLLPSDPSPIRIDRFIEKRFNVRPKYEDLPRGLLGFTRFGAKGVEEVVVSKALDDEGTQSAERRLRTTLAHEGGHGLLHAHLFAFGTRPDSLFGNGLDPHAPKIMCRDDAATDALGKAKQKPPYRWWEFQANQAMSALLLPKNLVIKALGPLVVARGLMGHTILPSDNRDQAIKLVVSTFDVNPVVAKIRLQTLYPASAEQQLTL